MSEPQIIYDYDPNNLPDDYLRAIGRAIASASQTEHILNTAVGGILGIQSHLTIVAATHMSIPLKMSILKSAAEFRLEVDDLDELDQILEKVQVAMGSRNKYAHDSWCQHPTTGQVYRQKENARVRLEMDLIQVSIDQIEHEAAVIYDTGLLLLAFLDTRGLLPSHPEALSPRDHKSPAARKRRRQNAERNS